MQSNKKATTPSAPRHPKLSAEAKERVLRDLKVSQDDEAEKRRLAEAKKNLATAKTSNAVI